MGEVQFHGANPDLVRCFHFALGEPSMEMAAVFRDLPPQFVAGFCAVDPQFLGEQPVTWLEHGKTLAPKRGIAQAA
jgi:hypothetical protein